MLTEFPALLHTVIHFHMQPKNLIYPHSSILFHGPLSASILSPPSFPTLSGFGFRRGEICRRWKIGRLPHSRVQIIQRTYAFSIDRGLLHTLELIECGLRQDISILGLREEKRNYIVIAQNAPKSFFSFHVHIFKSKFEENLSIFIKISRL